MARMGGKTRKRSTNRRPRKKPTLPTEASKLRMLQADLLQSQQEINKLLEKLADVNREKADMVANEVHLELLRMADERAKRAELRAMALEHELRQIKLHYHGEIDIYPMVKVYPDNERGHGGADTGKLRSDCGYHGSCQQLDKPPTLPPRAFDYTQGYNSHTNGNRPRNISSPASPHMFRKVYEPDTEFDRSRPTNRNQAKSPTESRSQSKSPKRSARITTNMIRAHSQGGADNKQKVTLLSRVQSRMEPKESKVSKSNNGHRTFLDRVHSKFFASKKKDAVTPCDLPDITTLMQYAVKAEYETPTEYMKNYTGTPLIKHDDTLTRRVAESEESDWTETEDEFLEPGIKKAKRDKAQQRRKQKQKERARATRDGSDKSKSSKDGGSDQKKEDAENRMDAGGKEDDEEAAEGGSQKGSSRSPKPPPIAPKPKKSSITNLSSSSLNSNDSQTKTNSTDAISQEKMMESCESLDGLRTPPSPGGPGREEPISFDEDVPERPQLKSYRRVQGPQGRRRPQRYSSQAMSQTMSTTLSQIMA